MEQYPVVQVDGLKRQFNSVLDKLKAELQKNLDQINLLDAEQVENTLNLFESRLVIAQHDFLEYLSGIVGHAKGKPAVFKLRQIAPGHIPEVTATILAGGGAALLTNLITFASSSWIFWTVSTSLAGVVGGAVGVSAGIATAGIGVGAGVGTGLAVRRLLAKSRRKRVRQSILEQYTEHAVPQLRKWAADHIQQATKG